MAEKHVLKWSGDDIIKFLDIYSKYESLWDTNNKNYMKKNARENSFNKFNARTAPGDEILRRKINNLKAVYRNEVKKENKSIREKNTRKLMDN